MKVGKIRDSVSTAGWRTRQIYISSRVAQFGVTIQIGANIEIPTSPIRRRSVQHTHLQHRLSKMFGPLNLSLAPQVKKSRTLYRWIKPLANWYAQLAGYRQMGLKYDDLCKCLILRPLFFCKKVYLFLS